MKLWHDDVRPPPDNTWFWARTNGNAMLRLRSGNVEEISLDHDLGYHDVELPEDSDKLAEVLRLRGEGEETGADLVMWMIREKYVPAKVTIHSWNPVGARNMAWLLNEAGYDVTVTPYEETK